jgi:hypothetical protein
VIDAIGFSGERRMYRYVRNGVRQTKLCIADSNVSSLSGKYSNMNAARAAVPYAPLCCMREKVGQQDVDLRKHDDILK